MRGIWLLMCLVAVGCGEKGPTPAEPAKPSPPESSASTTADRAAPVVEEHAKVKAIRDQSLQLAEVLALEVEASVAKLADSARVAETAQGLKYAAAYTMGKRRVPWRSAQAKDFSELQKAMAPEMAAQDPKAKILNPALDERLKTAMKLTLSDDAFERSAGYELLERTLGKLPNVDYRPYYIAHVPPYERAELAEERFHQLEPIAQRPFARVLPFLWRVALDDEDASVRYQALVGLESWIADHPEAGDADLVRAINAKWSDGVTQSGLFSLAGLVKVPELLEWCRNGLDGQSNARSCRVGLSRLGSAGAFELLYAWVVKRSEDKRLQGPNNYLFRDDFAHLTPYAAKPFANARYYALFDKVLGQVRRSGYATGMIVRRSADHEDASRTLEIVRRHQANYLQIWTPRHMKPDRKFLLDEFVKAISTLEARTASKPAPSTPAAP